MIVKAAGRAAERLVEPVTERGNAGGRKTSRTLRLPLVVAAVCITAACSGSTPAAAPQPTAATGTAQAAPGETSAEGALAPPDRAQGAFTYDPAQAPEGARVAVSARAGDGSTEVRLDVSGLLPNRGYAAHVHERPCGPTGAAAGPHHQHQVDPAATPDKPSTDPAFANPQNEIWLDLRTDGNGNGHRLATVPFVFSDRAPASVVIHQAEVTATEPGKAGTAGARVACLDVPFDEAASR
jgi:Cu-Zn family superoxide dismutase